MENRISIQNRSQLRIPPRKKLNALLETLCETLAANKTGVELVVLNDEQIRPYYREYFGEDRATDVIAFPLIGARVAPSTGKARGASPSRSLCSLVEDSLLGSIVISIDTAKRQAKEHGLSLWDELRFLIIHGFLHLLGHDHAEPEEKRVMQAKEQEMLALTASI